MKFDRIGNYITLSQGLAINSGSSHLVSDIKSDEFSLPLLRIADMMENSFSRYISVNVNPNVIAKEDDIIYTRTGQIGLAFKGFYGVVHNNSFIVHLNSNLITKNYLYTCLQTNFVRNQALKMAKSSVQPDLTHDMFKSIIIPIPESIDEQEKISKCYTDLLNKIKNNNCINSELESLVKTIYDYWFLQFEFPNEEGKPYKSSGGKMVWNDELKREIPEGWEVKAISEIASLYQPKTISGDEILQNGKYLVYGANGIVGTYNEYNHKNNEIAICCRGASCGDYLMTLPKSWITGNAMVVNISDPKLKEFVFYGLSKEGIAPFISGSAQPQITRTNLESMKLIMPTYELIDKFGKMAVSYRKQIENNAFQYQELTSLRDFLLPMLMNGQVTFKDN